ncbi:NAD(P)/FAD-dependent oxidoreductase (plasmid) [Agrobacterium radiobacter]|uniref:FAD dependent oxidoreductase n=1 Tax=Agrobacterium tumefaciens str. B6 TaxID=1183423 RepID=A0A822V725_AGRTU|nr:FAD-binding oxidoreductase [Agrobacterium tumefaciens]MQB27795.1 FAD-binding oxidoreductase [Agrobacterium tumefaciens]NTA08431.1 FAD-binding oxidoreductase [Agrobacterium tumefaciens]NTB16253.1 FAD-binding oxidoreductase [Agrobacterium tumefaciens]CVI25300.1 FAD dependent oxidoreductase [Agrobacterium tumefaciens str. B6]SPZ49555.1 hydroxyglutarate oxidase [Agrobacterium tumefaciens]
MIASTSSAEIAVIGAGNVGIAVAYYLNAKYGFRDIVIIDPRDPMSLTSAQSGENYRNWWPHPVMTAFTNDSIRLLEDIASKTGNRIQMTRRGYALVTRRARPQDLIEDLYVGYGADAEKLIRIHEGAGPHPSYSPAQSAGWEDEPAGVDVLCDEDLIRKMFPAFETDVATVLHVRRAGSISGQQLGQYMLEIIKDNGGRLLRGDVIAIEKASQFVLTVKAAEGQSEVRANRIVNAAGPFVNDIAEMLGETLGTSCIYQQKIAFEDRDGIVPRDLPFTIDLDGQRLAWTDEEREILCEDPLTAKLTEYMQGGIHCRPDGAESGKWIKLGWAFNSASSDPHSLEPIDEQFPDIVLRAASRLQPGLTSYIGRLPRGARHYGGYYTTTEENWPLIGPTKTPGVFVAGALSGFGTMAACATGELCADWIGGKPTATYAEMLTPARHQDPVLMAELKAQGSRGHL